MIANMYVTKRKKGATIRRKSTNKYKKKEQTHNKLAIWFGSGILIGIICTAVVISNWIQNIQNDDISHKPKLASANSKINKQNDSNEVASNKYDFYTMLPKISTSTGTSSTQQNRNSTSSFTHKNQRTLDIGQNIPTYLVQVGSFKSAVDAEELRAKLTLLGYSASKSQIKLKSGENWYRVSVGPFNSHDIAKNQQQRLEQDQFSGTLLVLQQNK